MKQKSINFKKSPNTLRTFIYAFLCLFFCLTSFKSTAQVYYGANQINLHLRSYFSGLAKPIGFPNYNYTMASHSIDSIFYTAQHADTTDSDIFYAMQKDMKAMAYDTINVTNADTTFKYANNFGPDTVQIGIMDYNYYRIKPVALSTNLYFNFDTVNDILTDLSSRPGYPYDTYNTCLLSPLMGSTSNAMVVYRIDPAFIFADVNNVNLYTGTATFKIDFGDGTGWHVMPTNSINYYTANYSGGTGNAVINWDLFTPDQIHKYGSAQMKTGSVSFPEPNSYLSMYNLNIGVYNSCSAISNPADKKVLIYLEGFDALDFIPSMDRGVAEIYNEQILKSGLDDLRRFGNDIYVVSWKNSRIDIKQNAQNVEGFIRWLKCNHPSEQPYVIIGESMGGLVARYALLDMEKNVLESECFKEKKHNTRLLITNDTPHRGANIPMSIQFLYQEITGLLGPFLQVAQKGILTAENLGLDGMAAKQMLYYHVNMCLPTSLPQAIYPSPFKTAFMNDLAALGNYPKLCKTMAMSDGSMSGANQTNDYDGSTRAANDDLLSFNSSVYINVLGLKIPIIQADLQLKTNPNGTAKVYHINAGTFGVQVRLKWWGIKVTIGYGSIIQSNTRRITSNGICVMAGGLMNGLKLGETSKNLAAGMQSLSGKLFKHHTSIVNNGGGSYTVHGQFGSSGWFGNDAHISSQGLHWNFVPISSALDYNTSDLSYNIEADGFAIPYKTPFTAITAIYDGCQEEGVKYKISDYRFYNNRRHVEIRNDLLTIDGSVSSIPSRAITYNGAACTAMQQVQFLNREIGDDELWLNNYDLTYNARFTPELTLNVEQSPYMNFMGQVPLAQRRGIYTKNKPMAVFAPGYAQFNYNASLGSFSQGYLSATSYNVTDYRLDICCLSGMRNANPTQQNLTAHYLDNNSLLIYPNPSNRDNSLNIEIVSEVNAVLKITNVLGEVVYTKLINGGTTQLNVTGSELKISAGIYFVTLQITNKMITQKLIIN